MTPHCELSTCQMATPATAKTHYPCCAYSVFLHLSFLCGSCLHGLDSATANSLQSLNKEEKEESMMFWWRCSCWSETILTVVTALIVVKVDCVYPGWYGLRVKGRSWCKAPAYTHLCFTHTDDIYISHVTSGRVLPEAKTPPVSLFHRNNN